MPRPDDPVECQLFTKYKSDLWRHRLKNTEPMAATHDQAEAPIKQDHGSLGMKMEADGSLTLCSRLGDVPIKKEESPPLQTEQSDDDAGNIEQSDDDAAGKTGKPVDGASLDPWAKAALKAIWQRKAGKAAAAKDKQAATAAAAKAKKAAQDAAKAKKAGKPLKVAAQAKKEVKVKEQVHEVAKADILKDTQLQSITMVV